MGEIISLLSYNPLNIVLILIPPPHFLSDSLVSDRPVCDPQACDPQVCDPPVSIPPVSDCPVTIHSISS